MIQPHLSGEREKEQEEAVNALLSDPACERQDYSAGGLVVTNKSIRDASALSKLNRWRLLKLIKIK